MTSPNDRNSAPTSVAEHMIRAPKLCGPTTTVSDVHDLFHDDHVHAALIAADGALSAVVERSDISSAPPDLPARLAGRLRGRVVGPGADLDTTWRAMVASGRRRLAVIDDHHVLLGLLCLKRTGKGFCSDSDVQARADSRA
ncbi:CBS domain-containing protein [Saccharopolyspora lacisalsi]|uniref:CBS domain-containing protein n=1 Tax=Halosaccharopolyspora lacisalsi TaxID=1000566 RepID=A0A839DPT5_9PSEU|nr:CBS domain-containing protein [Halosaccharopolyspora lacisalsi]MBA8824012.1 CBS domain-containing protein [Halosaccharopolyspora lacisalsi]